MDLSTLKEEVKRLQRESNWSGIYDRVKPINSLENNDALWGDDIFLNMVSYATAKLSETSVNLKWAFQTDNERKKFQSQ